MKWTHKNVPTGSLIKLRGTGDRYVTQARGAGTRIDTASRSDAVGFGERHRSVFDIIVLDNEGATASGQRLRSRRSRNDTVDTADTADRALRILQSNAYSSASDAPIRAPRPNRAVDFFLSNPKVQWQAFRRCAWLALIRVT